MPAEVDDVKDIKDLAERYRSSVEHINQAHYFTAHRAEVRGRILGIASVILGAIVGTSIFATIQSSPSVDWRISAGLLATVAAVLGAMQTFLDYAKRAAEHRTAGAAYGRLRREFDGFFLELATNGDRLQLTERLSQLRRRLDELGQGSPLIPDRFYKASRRRHSGSADRTATE